MRKIGISAVAMLFSVGFAFVAEAQSEMIADGLNTDLSPVDIKYNSEFYNQDEALGKVKLPEKPECSSPELYAKVMREVKKYTGKINADSTLTKRNKALISANIDGFHQIKTATFTPDEDVNTANALVMIKINDKIAESDITICRQNRNLPHPIYLIIHPYADNYRVYIINLDKNSSDYHDVTFIFP